MAQVHDSFALASEDRAWSLLIRHATRPEIPCGSFGNNLSITDEGRRQAKVMGQVLGSRVRRLVTSPVLRCVQTAEAICRGAGAPGPVTTNCVLGDPGIWIADGDAVGDVFLEHGPQGVVARQLGGHAVRGMTPLEIGAKRFVDALVPTPREPGAIDVFVSHDAVIAPLFAVLLGVQSLPEIWPGYLEGAFVGLGDDGLNVIWRGVHRRSPWRSA